MQLVPLEEELTELGVEVSRPHALLAVPLVAIAHTQGRLVQGEESRILDFAKGQLALDSSQEKLLRRWLVKAPPWQFVEHTLRALVLLRESGDGAGFENDVYRNVLAEGKELVRERSAEEARERGAAILQLMAERLQVDLGEPGQDVTPEVRETERQRERVAKPKS